MADRSIHIARGHSPDHPVQNEDRTSGPGLLTAQYFFSLGASFLRKSVANACSPGPIATGHEAYLGHPSLPPGLTSVEQPPSLSACCCSPALCHGRRPSLTPSARPSTPDQRSGQHRLTSSVHVLVYYALLILRTWICLPYLGSWFLPASPRYSSNMCVYTCTGSR